MVPFVTAAKPFSLVSYIAVVVCAAGFMPAVLYRLRACNGCRGSATCLGYLVIAAIVGFELYEFFQLPRGSHPTISSLLNQFMMLGVGARLILVVSWLLLGLELFW
jgi:hypothetical protein